MSYIFLLGRKDKLSIAELRFKLGNVASLGEQAAVFEGELPMPAQKFLDSLGGTVKICEIVGQTEKESECQGIIDKSLLEHFKDADSKVNFGVSLYRLTGGHEIFLKSLLKDSKKTLQTAGIKSRFVNKIFTNVANTAIADMGLLRHGIEICVFAEKEIYICKTVAVQDFKLYGFRDYERPARDRKSGMLPPKLAQMMINLSGAQPGQTIWDPFCGSGTILMEGLLMGMNVIGSDISGKAIQDSQANMQWLEHNFKFDGKWKISVQDAIKLKEEPKANAIVAETYLGPAVFQFPGEDNSKRFLEESAEIILGFLKNLTLTCPIILAMPFIRSRQKDYHIENFVEKAGELGYSVSALDNESKSLLYDRPEQTVGREIYRLQKSKSGN